MKVLTKSLAALFGFAVGFVSMGLIYSKRIKPKYLIPTPNDRPY